MRFHNFYQLLQLLNNPKKTSAEIKQIRQRKLHRLLSHAYENVPYYHELFHSSRIKPEDIRSIEDLRYIPLTSRETLQNLDLEDKTSARNRERPMRSSATSGTTGFPLRIYHSPEDATMMNLSWARAFLSSGMKPWEKMIAFIGRKDVDESKKWHEYLGLWRRTEISTWEPFECWIRDLKELKPSILIGYVMTLKILAEAVVNDNIPDISPRMIFHSSALLDAHSRAFIESALNTRIIDIYGSDEAGCIAWECPNCGGYHISTDMVIVEIIKNGGPAKKGEEGDIVITNLHSSAMPIIRYRQGDIGAFSVERPLCGNNFPLLNQVTGRTDDFIVLKSGRKISPHPFYHCIDPFPEVRRWRIIQEDSSGILVEIEPGKGYDLHVQNALKTKLENLLNGNLEIKIRTTDSLIIEPGTKFRAVHSRVEGYH